MKAKIENSTAESLRRQIEVRAYLIWERDGRPHGRHAEHWARAEQEIFGESNGKAPQKKKAKAASAAKPAVKSLAKRSTKTKKD